jgi:hypothetical protein
MKTLKLIVLGIVLFTASAIQAQVSVNVHVGTPPPWGPYGYNNVRYYYLPDVEAYYDVQSSMFIYNNRGVWVHKAHLPSRYRHYDLYGGYKVVMSDYHGDAPYTYYNEHRAKYARGYRGEPQRTFGERPGRGNSGRENSHEKERGNKERGHDRNMQKDHGHGDKDGKKK